jgi:hypothetical protein
MCVLFYCPPLRFYFSFCKMKPLFCFLFVLLLFGSNKIVASSCFGLGEGTSSKHDYVGYTKV